MVYQAKTSFASSPLDPPIRESLPPSPDAPFDIGLVMAGAISAGSYTAGVCDFLIEALDVWHQAKKDTPETTPPHSVRLRVATGASAGGINAAILAASLPYAFPPVRWADQNKAPSTGNPFFYAWVDALDLGAFLALQDLKEGPLTSLLNSHSLDDIAYATFRLPEAAPPKPRPYLDDAFAVYLTLTNLRGVPYWSDMTGNKDGGYGMMLHRDYRRFIIATRGKPDVYPDDYPLTFPVSQNPHMWSDLAETAMACSAFPAVFRARRLQRAKGDYTHRAVVRYDLNQSLFATVPPFFDEKEDDYSFWAVDGGAMDNEPLELARQHLCGVFGSSPRGGMQALRATILVDPFPEMDLPPAAPETLSVSSTLSHLISAWKNQVRFHPEDIGLASAQNVYSRFLISPSRNETNSSRGCHLASSLLEGFGGFFDRSLRVHDYMLGRRNAQWFLKKHLTLPESHPLFANWTPAMRDMYRVHREGADHPEQLPIIPLCHVVRDEEILPPWPKITTNPETLVDGVMNRLNAVYFKIVKDQGLSSMAQLYLGPLRRKVMKQARQQLLNLLTTSIKNSGL